jgi:pilus assembly protein FimV
MDADIALVSAKGEAVDQLDVSLAPLDTFQRYGIERPFVLSKLQFDVARHSDGTAYIHVTSSDPIKEPFLTFLVQAQWPHGKLLREYTVLLDPPVYANKEGGEAQAPATGSAQQQAGQAAMPAQEKPRSTAAQTRPMEPGEVPSQATAIPQTVPAGATGGGQSASNTYGRIQRNETLWGIARKLRPDDSVSVNQMMVALYRANPEAFYGNINRLKAGYILRVPSLAQIQQISRAQATSDVRDQNQQWRGHRSQVAANATAKSGASLRLVAPESSGKGAGVGTGGGSGDQVGELQKRVSDLQQKLADTQEQNATLQSRVDELQSKLEDAQRMVSVQDTGLAGAQAQAAQQNAAETGAAEDQSETAGQQAATEQPAQAEEQPEAEQAAQAEPSSQPTEAEATGAGTTAEQSSQAASGEQATQDEQPKAKPEATIPSVTSPPPAPSLVDTILDTLLNPVILGVILTILVVVIAAIVLVRRRRSAAASAAPEEIVAGGDWDEDAESGMDEFSAEEEGAALEEEASESPAAEEEEEDIFGDTASLRPAAEGAEESSAEVEAAGEQEGDDEFARTLVLDRSGGDDEHGDTIVGGRPVTLDESDPLSEADFHMAYGLYDQAADLMQKAIQRDPERRDYRLKLLEIHFAAGNREAFVSEASALRDQIGEAPDKDWDNVVIMGRQIAPDEGLFTGAAASAGASVDIDLAGGGGESSESTDMDVFGEGGDQDLSREGQEAEPALAGGEENDNSLDFELPELEEAGTGESAQAAAEPESADEGLEFDLGDFALDAGEEQSSSGEAGPEAAPETVEASGEENEVGTNSQTDFDRALEELSAFVDTNVPEGEQPTAEGAATEVAEETSSSADFALDDEELADEEEGSIGEVGTKLDLARAYIDMGDPDGARSILEEVMEEGNDEQKREAQELLGQVS